MLSGDRVTDNKKWFRGVGEIVQSDAMHSCVKWNVVWSNTPIHHWHDNDELTFTTAPVTPVTMTLYRRLYLALCEM